MTKIRRNALMMLALTLIYSTLQFSRPLAEINGLNITISLLLPVIGIIYALNEKANNWRWPLIIIHTLLFLLMLFIAINSH